MRSSSQHAVAGRAGPRFASGQETSVKEDTPDELGGLEEGQVLANRYRLEGVLGAGGMGVVLAARHLQLDTRVAIKFLRPSMMDHREAVTRFAQEARAAVRITSEHVARVFDVSALENGRPYMVMELLEGDDLGSWLEQRGPLSVVQAVEFVLQTCVALAEAHALGIVHRDLKPANLFAVKRSDGQLTIKVLDFGISKVADRSDAESNGAVTHSLAVMGSPLYMSPEQMQSSKDVDAQTDIWALGVIGYELLTGRVPYEGASIAEIAVKVATERPPPLRLHREDVSPGLEAAVLKCLEKSRTDRYASIAELARALLPFASARGVGFAERVAGIVDRARFSAAGIASSATERVVDAPAVSGRVLPNVSPSVRRKRSAAKGAAWLLAVVVGVVWVSRSHPLARRVVPVEVEPARLIDAVPPLPALEGAALAPDTPRSAEAARVQAPRYGAPPPAPAAAKRSPGVSPPQAPNTRRKPGCDPDFYFDDQGRKHFKPECFLSPR